jgi:SAM-dependent methyltransferase
MDPSSQPTYAALAVLYDIAFSWDIGPEVEWLLTRMGGRVGRVLEPACGSGRMFAEFARRGVEITGVEVEPTMIARARHRAARLCLPEPAIHPGDMTRFDLREAYEGAICPINSLGYLLGHDQLLMHLESVARHLVRGARYLVQLDLMDTGTSIDYARDDRNQWEVDCGALRLRSTWAGLSFDAGSGLQTDLCRFELLPPAVGGVAGRPVAGPTEGGFEPGMSWKLPAGVCSEDELAHLKPGVVHEDTHVMRKWSWEEWGALIAASPFRLAAAYAGEVPLTWFALTL